jgi:hypothetical protein
VALGLGCRKPADVTGLRVAATWAGFEPDQLSYALSTEDGSPLGEPEVRPAHAQGALVSGAAVVVYLAHDRAGQMVRCAVEALAAGQLLARGSATATVVGHQIVDVLVALTERVPLPTPGEVMGGDAGTILDADPTAQPPMDADPTPPEAFDTEPASPDATPPDERAADPDGAEPDGMGVVTEPPPADGPTAPPDLAADLPPPLKDRGQPCSQAAECATGFCSGGVCCAEACTGLCRSCAGSQPGTCLPTPLGTTCAPASCDNNAFKAQAPSTCDGQGTCAPGAVTNCAPYRCDGTVCATRCSGQSSCTPGWVCLNHLCRMSGGGGP